MQIAILHGPRDLRIEDHPLETQNLGPRQIWTQTRISALKIGTDRGNFEGAEQVPGAPDFPRWVGDSNLGIVRGVGSEVTEFAVGDRVVLNLPHQSDLVIDADGPVVKVPEGVADEDAVYAWLSALSALCYSKAGVQPGENVAVVGLGVLGLGAVALVPCSEPARSASATARSGSKWPQVSEPTRGSSTTTPTWRIDSTNSPGVRASTW